MLGRNVPLPGFVLDDFVRSSQRPAYKGFLDTYDSSEELDDTLAQISTPTTIIWGTRDTLIPLVCAHEFHAGITGSDLILLPECGHVPQTEQPDRVAEILLRTKSRG